MFVLYLIFAIMPKQQPGWFCRPHGDGKNLFCIAQTQDQEQAKIAAQQGALMGVKCPVEESLNPKMTVVADCHMIPLQVVRPEPNLVIREAR